MPFSGLKIRTESAEQMGTETGTELDPELFPLETDPVPSDLEGERPATPSPRKAPRPTAPLVTKQMEREARDEVHALVSMAALVWSVPDPECGGVLSEQSKAIAEGLVAVLKRNPRLLSYLRSAGWFGDWGLLFGALAPVAKAIYAHHLAPKEEPINDDHGHTTAPRLADFPAYLPRTGVGNPSVA